MGAGGGGTKDFPAALAGRGGYENSLTVLYKKFTILSIYGDVETGKFMSKIAGGQISKFSSTMAKYWTVNFCISRQFMMSNLKHLVNHEEVESELLLL